MTGETSGIDVPIQGKYTVQLQLKYYDKLKDCAY